MTRPCRIHIIGGPGSGKTTLAHRLSSTLAIPAHDLDMIGYASGAGARRLLPDRLADVAAIARREGWITEGIFLWWMEELLRRADVIVWLDIPWRIAAWRIVARHARASLAGTNWHKGLRRLWRILRHARRYYTGRAITPMAPDDDAAVTREATAVVLAACPTVVRCRSTRDVVRWLAQLHGVAIGTSSP